MIRPVPAVAVSNTGQAEKHIRAGRSLLVTRSGQVVALVLPFHRRMSDEEEARRMQPFAARLREESMGALEDQDEP